MPQPIYLDEATVLPPLESEILRSRPLIPWTQRLGEGDSCVDPLTDTAQCSAFDSFYAAFFRGMNLLVRKTQG